MAKKFVLVTGLNKVIDTINASTGAATILASVSAIADENSILYITATADDVTKFGAHYQKDSHWIWAKGKLFGSNPEIDSYLSSSTAIEGDIQVGDSVQNAILKLRYAIEHADKGVTSLTTHDDAWIVIDPDLNASTGAVTLNVSHGAAGSVTSSAVANSSLVTTWGGTATVTIPNVSIDAKGHVAGLSTSTVNVVTLPSEPVTTLTTSGDGVVVLTENTNASGAVTVSGSHAASGVTAGQYGAKTSNLKFNTVNVSVNATGHVVAISNNDISLGDAASHAAADFATAAHTHDVSMIGDVTAAKISLGTSEVAFNTTIKDGVVTKAKLADSIFGAVESGDASLVTGDAVYTAIQNKVTGAVKYRGTVATAAAIEAVDASYGDFVRATAEFTYNSSTVHAGDMLIKDSSTEKTWVIVHGESDSWRAIQVDGTQKIAANDATALNFKSGNIKFTYSDGSLAADASYVSLADGSNGYHGIVDAADAAKVITDNEKTTATAFNNVKTSVGLTDALGVDWDGKFTSGTSVVDAIKDLSTDLAAIDVPAVSYTAKVTSTTAGSVDLGTITVGDATYEVYGKDTVYVHPAKPTTGTASSSTAGTANASTVITAVNIDASGHVASVVASNIATAYNMRQITVNGTTTVNASNYSGALDLSAGANITLTADATNHKITISAADNTDEKVKAEASESKAYLLGQLNASVGTANHATYDTDVYVEAGALHATSLYEGAWSVHDSSNGDWGTIS